MNTVLRAVIVIWAAAVPMTPAVAQNAPATSTDRMQRVAEVAAENRLRLDRQGDRFSGPAWDRLVEAGRNSQFFLIGEEHGIAENPMLAAQLFEALVPAGYSKMGIEVSPPMAAELDEAARGGLAGVRRLFADREAWMAFYTTRQEAALAAAARRAVPSEAPVLWGLDYEVAADRRLIALLEPFPKPPAAAAALAALKAASAESWSRYEETRGPQHIFSFAGDPVLVRAVRTAWPDANDQARRVLDTLEETLEINQLWTAGKNYESNQRRANFLRENFLRHWRSEKTAGRSPRVMLKFGAAHVIRGLNSNDAFDIGALVPEVAALEDGTAFHLLVVSGPGSEVARFDPVAFEYRSAPGGSETVSLGPITEQAWPDSMTLIDLRPLRSIIRSAREGWHPNLVRTVHGFDAILILSGSTAAAPL
jgi:hypothetical protein